MAKKIDWSKRIIKAKDKTEYIDLQGLPYYTIHWDENSKVENIYDMDIIIPTEPPDDHCANYGLPEYEQIFRLTHIPKQVRFPTRDHGKDKWSKEELDGFIDAEWNRRRNGIWFWIKGKKVYIPGLLYMKMNYWVSSTKQKFIYKNTDRKLFMFWMFCVHDPKCDGIIIFKCRQIGDTENAVLMMWEYGSRVRGTINAIQSCVNGDGAEDAYKRLVHGHINMMYYFM